MAYRPQKSEREEINVRTHCTDEAGRTDVPTTGNQKEVSGLCRGFDYRSQILPNDTLPIILVSVR